jgi:hypothetical protein
MRQVSIDVSGLTVPAPEYTLFSIDTVEIIEYSGRKKDPFGENIYEENNFEPDWEVTGDLTLNLRSERTGYSTGRTYEITIKVEVTGPPEAPCDGSNVAYFTTEVHVPHDQS